MNKRVFVLRRLLLKWKSLKQILRNNLRGQTSDGPRERIGDSRREYTLAKVAARIIVHSFEEGLILVSRLLVSVKFHDGPELHPVSI
jgi:hypothetical protein